jgi:hypothetical protein
MKKVIVDYYQCEDCSHSWSESHEITPGGEGGYVCWPLITGCTECKGEVKLSRFPPGYVKVDVLVTEDACV